ncbi:MAG: D-alanyl-D-alanine carboxypeptidase family protein, partial [Alphaproteobacteria bacterium]
MGKIGSALGAILLMLSVVMVGVGAVQAAPIRAHLIVDAASGEVLSAQNPDATVYPASLTKMMTLYLLFESLHSGQLQLNDWLDVSQNAAMAKPTKLGLKAGSRITVKDAMLGLMTKSANDASVVIAEHLAGDVDSFARRMSFKAKKLGMNHTIYKNAN